MQAFDREKQGGEAYQLVRCRRCKLVYLNPRPAESASQKYYQQETYLPFVSTKSGLSVTEWLYKTLRRFNSRWKRRQIEKWHPQKGKLLDVGCGTGEFLKEMVDHGWDGRGMERDPQAVAHAIEQLKLRAFVGTLENLPSVSESYDVVTLWHVLEHLYDPHNAVQKIRDLLKPGGLLVIAVPNINSVDARFYRQYWVALDTPRHLMHFNLKTLRMMCEMHKFELMAHKNLPLDAFFNSFASEMEIEKFSGSSRWLRPLRLMRAGAVAKASLLAGLQ
ncbi:MAG: class I SAM-dependent methyltransferase, partial [Calditrichaeota bacterium]